MAVISTSQQAGGLARPNDWQAPLSPLAKQLVYPPIVLMQLVPKIAVAPLFLVWLGFGIESKVLLTVLMTFFPLLLASISGFQILDDRLLYLTKSMGATRWQTFRYLRFPAALPVIFSGIKTSATIAATAAIVATLAAGLTFAAEWAVAAGTPVTFQLNWMAGGPNAGFEAAVEEGFYRDAGLDVTIVQGNGSANTAQLVANGRAQLAYADAVSVSQLIAKGAPMKIVATIYQSNPNAVMALKKTGIKSVKDLAGKKVGVPSASSQTTMLPLLLKSNNLKESDITMIDMPVRSMVPALLQGQVDAVLGSIDAYQIQAEAQGAQLDVYRFADYGVPTVSTSIFASDSYLKENPEVVKKFIAASLKGWSFALDNPQKAIKDVKTVFPETNEKLATAELAAITPLFCSGGAKYIGKAEDALWAKSQDLLSEVKLLPVGQDPKTYYTNAYLPPSSQMRACKSS